MAQTSCPNKHKQRDECISAIELVLARLISTDRDEENTEARLYPAVQLMLDHRFVPTRTHYLTVRRGYLVARATEKGALRELRVADTDHDGAFRNWNKTVRTAGGRLLSRELAQLTGNVLPGDLVKQSYRDEVNLTGSLLEQLPVLTHLRGDPEELGVLELAHAMLAKQVGIAEAAERARRKAKEVLDTATRQFDKDWMDTVRVLQSMCPELASELLPTFAVAPPKPKGAPAEPAVGADDEEEEIPEPGEEPCGTSILPLGSS